MKITENLLNKRYVQAEIWTSENGKQFPLQNVKVNKYSFQLSFFPTYADKKKRIEKRILLKLKFVVVITK